MGSYAEICEKFDWKEVEKEFDWKENINVAHECCDRHAGIALFWEGENGKRRYTFRELRLLSNRAANFLESFGIQKGDRVATLLPRIPETFIFSLAIWKIGAICVPLFTAFGRDSIKYRMDDCEAKTLITDSKNKQKIEDSWRDLILVDSILDEVEKFSDKYEVCKTKDDDVFDILYTSGTTGYPKGSMIHHGGIKWLFVWGKYGLNLKKVGLIFSTPDPSWSYGRFSIGLASWLFGNPILVYEGGFDGEKWLRLMEKYKVGGVAAVPTAYRMLLSLGARIKKFDLNVKVFYTAGEPATKELVEKVEKVFGIPLYESYGLTEVAMLINNYFGIDSWKVKAGSVGRPLPGFDVRLVGEDGREVKKGETGEIAVKLSQKMRAIGYWKKEREWEEKTIDGYFLTGDLAYEDKDGYYWFVGRKDDLIKTSGYRIGPIEIENAMMSHQSVREVAVISKPDRIRGNIIKGFVVLKEEAKPSDKIVEELKDIVKERVSKVAYPREIEFIKDLPKTESGKIKRGELRKLNEKKVLHSI